MAIEKRFGVGGGQVAGCQIDENHCENCGSTDWMNTERQGYTDCCNELIFEVVVERSMCRDLHTEGWCPGCQADHKPPWHDPE